MVATGLTVMVSTKVVGPAEAVTLYVAVSTVAVVLVSVPVTEEAGPPPASPVTPDWADITAQVYVVPPGIVPVGVYEKGTPVQVEPACEVIELPPAGTTVAVSVNCVVAHPFPGVAVTLVYVAVRLPGPGLLSVLVTLDAPAPAAPPVTPGWSVGKLHVYVVVPGIVPVGVYENATPLVTPVVCEAIAATGLMVTDTVKTAPPHVPDVGETTYVAVAAEAVVLVSVAVTALGVPVLAAPPVKPAPPGAAAHVYVVPAGRLAGTATVGVYEKATPLHIGVASACEAIVATGLTDTESVNAAPKHPPDEGVTTYVAVTCAFVVLVRVPLIWFCVVPVAPPVKPTPPGATDHEYVVPPGIVPVGVYEKATALHADEEAACEAIVAPPLWVNVVDVPALVVTVTVVPPPPVAGIPVALLMVICVPLFTV
jgi:hypothetical protein